MPNIIQTIDSLLGLPALIAGAFGIGLLIAAFFKIRRRRLLQAGFQGVFALFFMALAGFFLSVGLNLYTYHRLTMEEPIARVDFWESGSQKYLTVVTIPGEEDEKNFMIAGDEWQIDARILKWKTPATLAGLDSRYRLERLSGRYNDISQERESLRSVYELSAEPGLAIWPLLAKMPCCTGWIDTYFGNSTYMPMADRASFEVVLTQSGIIARPVNDAAVRAVASWN